MKALGTGISAQVRWTDIEILNATVNRPILRLKGGALRRARRLSPKGASLTIHVSLLDKSTTATAYVFVETHPCVENR